MHSHINEHKDTHTRNCKRRINRTEMFSSSLAFVGAGACACTRSYPMGGALQGAFYCTKFGLIGVN